MVSASTQDAPPCSRPCGWVLPSTGMVATTRDADADAIVMPIRPASVPSATVLAVIFSSVSWSIRTHPCFRSSGPPNRFPCERARHREAPRRAARTPARTLRRERSNKFHRKILCLRG